MVLPSILDFHSTIKFSVIPREIIWLLSHTSTELTFVTVTKNIQFNALFYSSSQLFSWP